MKFTISFPFFAIFFWSVTLQAQHSSLWANLEAGSYTPGYKVLWATDYSRNWGSGGRPIRMNVRYPAEPGKGSKMLFEKYLFSEPPNNSFSLYNQKLRDRDIGNASASLKGLFKGSEKLFNALMKTQTEAVENADPVKNKFPVVVYSLGQNDYSQENTIMSEYLASHGYIVIAVPQIGVSPRKTLLMIDEEMSFETQVRDLEFVVGQVHQHLISNADEDKIATVGMSMGGVYALLLAMRNPNIRLIVGLDPSFLWQYSSYGLKYWNLKYYDPRNIKIPIVALYRDEEGNNYNLVNALKFSERTLAKYPKLVHADFTSYPMYTATSPVNDIDDFAIKRRDQATAVAGHVRVCSAVLNALDIHLKGKSGIVPDESKDYVIKSALQAPNEEEFCQLLEKRGLQETLKVFEEVSAKYPGDTIIRENKIRRMGFEYSIDNNLAQATGVYTLYTKAFPHSSYAFSNLAEIQSRSGNNIEAAKNAQRAIELDPGNSDAKELLEKLKTN